MLNVTLSNEVYKEFYDKGGKMLRSRNYLFKKIIIISWENTCFDNIKKAKHLFFASIDRTLWIYVWRIDAATSLKNEWLKQILYATSKN